MKHIRATRHLVPVTTYRGLGHDQPKFLSRIMDTMTRLSKARDLEMRTYKAITAKK